MKSRKFEPFPQEGDGQFCWLYIGLLFTLIESEDIRKQKFSGKVYTAINVTAIRLVAIDFTAFYCHRLHISEDYKNRPHFVQFTKTALLAYLRLGQVVTKNALRLLNSPNYLV